MQEELDDLEEGTAEARRNAEEHGTIPDSTPDPTFIDPDADGRRDDADEHPGTTMGF